MSIWTINGCPEVVTAVEILNRTRLSSHRVCLRWSTKSTTWALCLVCMGTRGLRHARASPDRQVTSLKTLRFSRCGTWTFGNMITVLHRAGIRNLDTQRCEMRYLPNRTRSCTRCVSRELTKFGLGVPRLATVGELLVILLALGGKSFSSSYST
jgi:hypothetical protein